MVAPDRRTDPSLEDTLFEEGYLFDFFQAVRLLERLFPNRRPIGRDTEPHQEVVRFRSRLSMAFPPSAIYEIAHEEREEDEDRQVRMTVAFMGLTGPLGVLPNCYTELMIERAHRKDPTMREFLDLFNHRMISLFFRAWEKYRFPIAYERGEHDHFSQYLLDLMGMGTKGLRGRLEIADDRLLFYVGLLAQRPPSAHALELLLQDYFGVPIAVCQFEGEWIKLDEENQSSFGSKGKNNELGVSTIMGARIWDQHAKFRIKVGPLTFQEFSEFLPDGAAFHSMAQLVRFFVGQEFDFDIQLILKACEVPPCRLENSGPGGAKLGWSAWLKTKEFPHDAERPILSVEYL
ncbi:MAG: type VI secretion system baseplate subunit TssG [Candidatus Binatia bacterium]|jgi:type VI secretion system protein ImpH|nr:type VI secretion system baseplate subunit TssG [Candidatus Binatia bacterium]